jgi:ferredoxin
MGCHECRELCPEGAIYYETDIEVERFVDDGVRQLIKRQWLKCPKCRKMFFPDFHPDGCPTCKKLNNMDNRIGRILFGQTWDGEKTRFGKEIT